jgi:hypothetical protein
MERRLAGDRTLNLVASTVLCQAFGQAHVFAELPKLDSQVLFIREGDCLNRAKLRATVTAEHAVERVSDDGALPHIIPNVNVVLAEIRANSVAETNV